MIKLCYKKYPYKMTLGAMKNYSNATDGRDLWCDMLHFMEVWYETSGDDLISRMRKLHDVLSFENGAHVFHSMIRGEDSNIPLSEIEDAMFAVGWMPTERPSDMSEPWPFVMLIIARAINDEMAEYSKKKNTPDIEQ
jgi:hypothetical protein